MRQHERFPEFPVSIKRIPCFLLQLEKNHKIPPSTLDEDRFPCIDSRTIPRSPSELGRRLDFFYANPRVP